MTFETKKLAGWEMTMLKLALTMTVLCTASAPYSKAQVRKQSNLDVNKATVSNPVEKEPQYYELRCHGGAELVPSDNTIPSTQQLRFTITQGRRTDATDEQLMNMVVDFVAGTKPVDASGSNLLAGQCSWVDRGFRPGEPTQIRQEIIYFGQGKQELHGTPVDRSLTAAERHPDSQNVPLYMSYRQHYWSFFVRNTGQGYFEATSSRYWKPVNISDVRKAGSGSRANGAGADELNPQPLPPCERCPEVRKVRVEEKKKPLR